MGKNSAARAFAINVCCGLIAVLGYTLSSRGIIGAVTARHWRTASRVAISYFYLNAAKLRLDPITVERLLLPITPPFIPEALRLPAIQFSGLVEAFAALYIWVDEAFAAWTIIALLVAVFPANLYHAFWEKPQKETRIGPPLVHIRLAIQLLFGCWAHWHTTTV